MAKILDLACYFLPMVAAALHYYTDDTQGAIFFAIVALWFQPKDK